MKIGDQAPDYELPNQDGVMVRLSALAPGKSLVVFFYPKSLSRYQVIRLKL
ncbi:MAG: redoxin domain-containing protein [Planctomycetaceae bacterium]|nr:redoxin domain-containing protein [Planctomycetaceae bacterium]